MYLMLMIIGVLCVGLVTLGTAIYLLLPLPLISYKQGDSVTCVGQVTKVAHIRPGVFEIHLMRGMTVDPRLQQGDLRMTSATLSEILHFRKMTGIPALGDKISTSFTNRLHLFTGRSFNWVQDWKFTREAIPPAGKVEPVMV